jgi:serine/threonine protein kinase
MTPLSDLAFLSGNSASLSDFEGETGSGINSSAIDPHYHYHITNFWISRFDSDCSQLTDCTDDTPVYMAPELRMEPSPITNKIDVFCYGTLICTIFMWDFEFRCGIPENDSRAGNPG